MVVKSLDPLRAYLGPVLNGRTQFQLLSSIWREVIRKTNSEKEKRQPKIYFCRAATSLRLLRSEIGLKSRDLQKAHLGHLLNVHS